MSSLRRRLKITTLLFFLDEANAIRNKTTKVVVLIPPAVEPGLPPISISTVVSRELLSESEDKSVVLNPAVLGVTA